MEIKVHSNGTATIRVPVELLPALKQSLALAIRNERVQASFVELRSRMKADDAFSVLQQEFYLSRSSLNKIVYPLPEEDEV